MPARSKQRIAKYKTGVMLGFFVLGIGLAHAQQRTLAIYGDWTVSCATTSASKPAKTCGLVQVQKTNGKPGAASQIGIGRDTRNEPFKLSIELRPNVWIPTGVKLVTSDKAISANFKWCISTRCLADTDLTDADVSNLRAQNQPGRITYKNGSQADVSTPVSFSGFNEAMDALQKE